MLLTAPQQEAVCHMGGPCLVVAGPGSGKTAVITLRIQNLIDAGILPNKILVITYTKAAAMEMMERFKKTTDTSSSVVFGTFHSVFYGILRQEMNLDQNALITGNKRLDLIKMAALSCRKDVDDNLISLLSSEISYVSNTLIDKECYSSVSMDTDFLYAVIDKYEEIKAKRKVIDFDDMLHKTYNLLKDNELLLSKWQDRFEFFLVDEMQDMNNLQYRAITLLAGKSRNLFMVGDDDQSIYGFRGANPSIMMDFTREWQDTKRIVLDENFRCPSNVVQASLRLIENNTNRFIKEIQSYKGEASIILNQYADTVDEAANIIKTIELLHQNGMAYSDIGILYRNNSQTAALVDQLISTSIPFYLKDKLPNIYNHWVIRDIESYMRLALGRQGTGDILAIMNKPNRGITRDSIDFCGSDLEKLKSYYVSSNKLSQSIEELIRDLNFVSKMSPFAALKYIAKGINYEDYLRRYAEKTSAELNSLIAVFESLYPLAMANKSIDEFLKSIELHRNKMDEKNSEIVKNHREGVGLLTLHSSKGLQFEVVFIMDVNEGIIPSSKAVTKDMIEEERRMFYVGITRTKGDLYLCSLKEKNRNRLNLSRFVDELKI